MYKTIILPVVLYGCETWSVTLRKERRLRMFESRVLKYILAKMYLKSLEVTAKRSKQKERTLNYTRSKLHNSTTC
jgi:hypothetical protein